jgi:hypothetical protein
MIINPIEASALFTTIVGLICNWKQERATVATDRYQDFMAWLIQHNFNDLNDRIFASEELQRDLSALLSQDISVISTKLDTIVGSLSAVADKIDTLSQLGRTLGADTEALSEQAIDILKAFDESASINMIYQEFTHELIFPCCQKSARVSEPRFIENDLSALQKFHYIQLVGHTPKGAEKYAMTRLGCHFVKTIKETTPNNHETNDSLSQSDVPHFSF